MMLPNEDLINTELISTRNDLEQLKISTERFVRLYETLKETPGFIKNILGMDESVNAEIANIHMLTDENFIDNSPYPNGCNKDDYDQGMEDFFSMLLTFPDVSLEQRAKKMDQLLQTTDSKNPIILAHCISYLLIDENGPTLYKNLHPYI